MRTVTIDGVTLTEAQINEAKRKLEQAAPCIGSSLTAGLCYGALLIEHNGSSVKISCSPNPVQFGKEGLINCIRYLIAALREKYGIDYTG